MPGYGSAGQPHGRFARWPDSVLAPLKERLLARDGTPGVSLWAPLLAGLTRFLREQVAPEILPHGHCVYVPCKALAACAGSRVTVALLDRVVLGLGGPRVSGPPALLVSRLVGALEDLVAAASKPVVVCLDDADRAREAARLLADLATGWDNFHVLAASHEPLDLPLTPYTLPPLDAEQAGTLLGHRLSDAEAKEVMVWTGGRPIFVLDLAELMAGAPSTSSRTEPVRWAAEHVCKSRKPHPYRERLACELTLGEQGLLADLSSGKAEMGRNPALQRLMHLGIVRKDASGRVQFTSRIVERWIAQEAQSLCRVMTEDSLRVMSASEAEALLRDALRESENADYVVVDRRTNLVRHRGHRVTPAPKPLNLLRIVLDTAAAAGDRDKITPWSVLEGYSGLSPKPRDWAYDAAKALREALGKAEVIKTEPYEGMRLSPRTRFLWVEGWQE